MASLFDGFIDQYMLDEMGPDWVEGDIPSSLMESDPVKDKIASEVGPAVMNTIMEPRTISMEGPQLPIDYEGADGQQTRDLEGPRFPMGYGDDLGPPGSGAPQFPGQTAQQVNQLSAEESGLPMFGDRPSMDINQVSQQDVMPQAPAPGAATPQDMAAARGQVPGRFNAPNDPRPTMPDAPNIFERKLNPDGYKNQVAKFKLEDDAWKGRQKQRKMQAFAEQTQDPRIKRALLSGVPEVEKEAIKQLYTAQKNKRTSDIENFEYGQGLTGPARAAWDQREAAKRTPLVSVNNNPVKGRTLAEQVDIDDRLAGAKDSRTYVSGVIDTGRGTRDDIIKADRMMDLLDSGVKTGFGQDYITTAKQIAQTLGIKADTASAEELQTLMGDLVMKRVEQTKGAVSEKEMDLFKQYSANFGKSPEGNKAIITFYKDMLNRDQEIGKMARKMRKAGVRNSVIETKIDDYVDANPIGIKAPEAEAPAQGGGGGGMQTFANMQEWIDAGRPKPGGK